MDIMPVRPATDRLWIVAMVSKQKRNSLMGTKKAKLLNTVAMKKKPSTPVPDDSGHIGLEWVGDHPICPPIKPEEEEDKTNWGMVTGQSGG
jgi:hypothetical protein